MSILRLLTQTCTVYTHTAGSRDEYGEVADTFTAGTSYPCRLEFRTGTENLNDRDTQLAGYLLFLPPEAVLDGHDRVVVDGVTYEVDGPPLKQSTPRGVHHIEARLKTSA